MGCLNFSLISYKDKAMHKGFENAGLESRKIEILNGSTVHCWVPKGYTSPPPADKPVVMLLHGFGANAVWQWDANVRALIEHFTLIIPDLIFFGQSTTESLKRSESFQAESMWMCLTSLGIEKFSLVGTSYGGFVSYRIAQSHPEAVHKIILSNSAILMTPEDDVALAKRGGAENMPDLLLPTTVGAVSRLTNLVFKKNPFGWSPTFLLRDYINVLYSPNRERKVEMLDALVFGKENAPSLMTKVDKDVLIVWGEDDQVFLPEQAERINNYLGERAELVILKDSGHATQLEQAVKWNQLAIDFLLKK